MISSEALDGILRGKSWKDITLDDTARIIETIAPQVWKRLLTKHINAPGSHYGFKLVAAMLGNSIIESMRQSRTHAHNISAAAGILERYDYPTYYVAGPLLQALIHTSPPEKGSWKDVFFPYDAVVFMLPRGMLHEPNGEEIPLIGVCRFRVDYAVSIPGTSMVVTGRNNRSGGIWDEDRISVFWTTQAGMVSQDCTFPISQTLEPDAGWIDAKTKEYQQYNSMTADAPTGEFSKYIAGIAANLLLAMQSRRELVEHGRRTKKILPKGNRPIWEPTYIGRKYVVLRQQRMVGEGGHFTEIGWRSGYIRKQHYGKGSTETKMVMIDPYIAFTRGLVRTP